MSVAIRAITRIQDADDLNVTLGVGVDEYALCWDNDTAKFVLRAPVAAPDLSGYALLAGRAGGQTLYGGTAANDDITIHGTSDATRTTSYVILQPSGGNVGIATTAPVGRLHIGAGGIETTWEPKVIVSEIIDSSGSGNPHSFVDVSRVNRSGIALASFDASTTFEGAYNYDHYAAHKSRMFYECSGTMDKYYGMFSDLIMSGSSGTVTNAYRFFGQEAADTAGNSTIVNNYGLFVGELFRGTAKNFAVYTAGTTPNYFGGNVGLGIETPNYPLHIHGSTVGALQITNDTTGTTTSDGFLIFTLDANANIVQRENALLNFYTNNTKQVSITGDGKVGIGTDAPTYALDVSRIQNSATRIFVQNSNPNTAASSGVVFGESLTSGSYGYVQFNSTSFTANGMFLPSVTLLVGTGANGTGIAATNAAGVVRVYTGGFADANERMRVTAAGNVGINDAAPAEKLDVTGNINATGVYKVDDVQVLSNRVIDARAADVANSGDATTDGLIDALRDAMIAHGLIAAA